MTPLTTPRSSLENKPRPNAAQRLASITTRLILLAVIAGGWLTVANNLWNLRPTDADDALTRQDAVAPDELPLQAGLPLHRRLIRGTEAAAREALVEAGRHFLEQARHGLAEWPPAQAPSSAPAEPFENAVELARDPLDQWTIHELQEPRRLVVGVAHSGRGPTIVFWGGYDETGPDEWTTWTMLLPLPVN